MLISMDRAAIDRLVANIGELERLFEQAKDYPASPAWRQLLGRIEQMQEQIERLLAH
jgi:hypothetical protein